MIGNINVQWDLSDQRVDEILKAVAREAKQESANQGVDKQQQSSSGRQAVAVARQAVLKAVAREAKQESAEETGQLCPKHAPYSDTAKRLRTFLQRPFYTGCPLWKTQSPEEMAEVGFFFLGYSDHVRCFSCDGSLFSWQPDEDPFE